MNQKPYASQTAPLVRSITIGQAVDNSPTLGRLAEAVAESSARLKSIESLIPPTLRSAIKAGPIEGDSWCLLVHGNAAAAKLRQLGPHILTSLAAQGWKVTSIRLKILIASK